MDKKVLCIGLDGATYKKIAPAVEAGKMSSLEEIMSSGYSTKLESVIPPLSTYSWPSIFTGVNAAQLGIYALSPLSGRMDFLDQPPNFDDIEVKSVWRIISEAGGKSGVINIPVTYPPEEIDGFIVSGFLSPSHNADYFYPQSISEKLKDYKIDIDFGSGLGIIPDSPMDKNDALDELEQLADTRYDTCKNLIKDEELDFFLVNFKGLDVVQHLFWNEDDVIFDFLEKLDRYIQELKELFEPDYLFVFSDHGFHERSEKYLNLNTWLEKEGYLKTRKNPVKKIENSLKGFGKKLVEKLLFLRRLIPEGVKKGYMSEKQILDTVNWKKSKAFASRWGIYCKDDETKNTLMDKLEREGFFKEIYTKEKLFDGPKKDSLPEIIPLPKEKYKINPNLTKEVVTERKDVPNKTGDHNCDNEGIFVLEGEGVKNEDDSKSVNCHVLDLTPTILHLLGVPVPENLDGEVKKNFFEEGSDIRKREIKKQESSRVTKNEKHGEKEEKIKERLESLGYVD